MAVIEFNNIDFHYNKNEEIFKDLTFKIASSKNIGHIYGLMGPSGCGKSTLLKLILNIIFPDSGNININTNNRPLSYLPQEPIIFEHLSIIENARYFKNIRNYKNNFNDVLFKDLTNKLELTEIIKSKKKVYQLSGGQKQRIALLRALSIKPEVLLLDEPLSGIDDIIKENFLKILLDVCVKYNILVIYVTHHFTEIDFISDHILYLDKPLSNGMAAKLFVSKIENFKQLPPTISAFKVTLGNDGVVMPIYTTNDLNKGFSLEYGQKYNNKYFLGFSPTDLIVNKDNGYKTTFIHKNKNYCLLKLKDNDFLINVPSNKIANLDNGNLRITIPEKCILYDSEGYLKFRIQLKTNTIETI